MYSDDFASNFIGVDFHTNHKESVVRVNKVLELFLDKFIAETTLAFALVARTIRASIWPPLNIFVVLEQNVELFVLSKFLLSKTIVDVFCAD